jgi:23S rRNA pseudouridine2605 synthase
MARRHEDRKPGQRFARSGTASKKAAPKRGVAKKGVAKKAPAKAVAAKKAPAKKGPAKRGTSLRTAPVKRAPLRGSKRKAEGLTVTPSSIFTGSAVNKDGLIRLNHFLAKAGVCSRRAADELVAAGRVMVNGEVIREHGLRVDPTDDDVRFDGVRLEPERAVYVLLNKPKGVVCTNAAHEKKKRVVDLLPQIRGRVFTVGRLDMDSEGLLMVTNDGAFAQEMTHPRYGVSKLYSIVVRGRIDDKDLTRARGGVWLSEGPTAGMEIKIDRLAKERTFLKVTLREGKNREIRRVFAKLGYPVTSLKRIRIGHLSLHGLGDGEWRFLQLDEVGKLRDLAREEQAPEPASAKRRRNVFADTGVRSRTKAQPKSAASAAPRSRARASGKAVRKPAVKTTRR